MPAAADGPRWATWSILCLCRRDRAHEVDLDLVAGRDAAHERRARRRRRAGRPRGSAGCCRRGASTRRRGRCRGSRVRAPRRRWPTPPTRGSCAGRARSRTRSTPSPPTETAWSSACWRAALTGARVRDAAATAALSMTRLMIMSTTSGSTSTGSAATSAMRQASWPSRARFSSLRWTRRWWMTVMLLPLSARSWASSRRARRTPGCSRARCAGARASRGRRGRHRAPRSPRR